MRFMFNRQCSKFLKNYRIVNLLFRIRSINFEMSIRIRLKLNLKSRMESVD